MNRFSSLGPEYKIQSNYIPLPLDLIAKKLEQQQEKHDAVKASFNAMENTVLGVKGLGVDAEALKAKQAEYNDEIAKGIEEVGGDYYRLGGLSESIARKLQKDLTVGHLAAIQSNYATTAKHQEDMDKWRLAGGGDRGYNLAMRKLSEFEGTRQNPDGTYTKVNTYTPVKEESLPKMAQERASASVEQYDNMGRRYRTAASVAAHTFNSLRQDESAVSNAREEIEYRYGKLSPEKESAAIDAYLQGISNNAANQRSFYEIHKPKEVETDPYSGAPVSSYDIIMAPRNSRKFGAKGTEHTAAVSRTLAGTLSLIYAITPDPLKIGAALDKVNWANVKSEELEQTRKNIVGNSDLYKVFKSMGKDPASMSAEELGKTLNDLTALESSSRAGRISYFVGKDGTPLQRRKETASQIQHGKVTIAETGEEVTDKKELIEGIFNTQDDKPKALFSGETQSGYLMPGSNTYYLNGVTYVIEPPVTRSEAIVDNAIEMALRTGFYKYTVGSRTVTAIPETYGDPESKVNFEIDGKPVKEDDLQYLMGHK